MFAHRGGSALAPENTCAAFDNGLALGADGYITKPYSKNQLAEVIGRVLKQPLAGEQPRQP